MSLHEFESVIELKVKIVVDHYVNNPPDWSADNDVDYYGEYDIDWHLEDSEGNRLTAVENALSRDECLRIVDWIEDEMKWLREHYNG